MPRTTTVSTLTLANSLVLRNEASALYAVNLWAEVSGFFLLFDSATAPDDGVVTPLKWWAFDASINESIEINFETPITGSDGLSIVFSVGADPFTKLTPGSAYAAISAEVGFSNQSGGLYRKISNAVQLLWDAGWSHSDVTTYWRANDAEVLPDPSTTSWFMRNEVSFGRETVRAFGGGIGANYRAQFGSVIVRVFASRALQSEDTALDLLADGMEIFRSVRSGTLSFIGEGSGIDEGPSEDGNWFYRGGLMVFEYRFTG